VITANMRWAGYVARVGEKRGVCKVLGGKLGGKRPACRRGENVKESVLKKSVGKAWNGMIWLRAGATGGLL
jgi:hypothetical protein